MSYLDDLRPASFTSPSGVVHSFHFDELTRAGGKKVAINDILDSNEGAAQDQGNNPHVFTMDIYFTGDDYDKAADAFWDALSEKYTSDAAGLLQHPRWGDISVMPVSWTQSESFAGGAGVGKFSVEFRRVYKTSWPRLDEEIESSALSDINALEDESPIGKLKTGVAAMANIAAKIQSAASTVIASLKAVAAIAESVIAEIEDVQNSINSMIDDIGNNIASVILSVQYLMSLPAKIVDGTLEKLNGYKTMVAGLINGMDTPGKLSNDDKINNAVLLEIIAGYGVAVMAEAALFTNFATRSAAGEGINMLRESCEAFSAALEKFQVSGQAVSHTYNIDHDYLAAVNRVVTKTQMVITNRALRLKAERRVILSAPSDPVTLCARYFNAVDNDTIAFFCQINNLTGDEFLSVPAGREVVFY